jgi:hypothetical protein
MTIAHFLLLFALCLQFYNTGTRVGAADYVAFHKFYLGRIPLPVIIPGFLSFLTPVAVLIWLPQGVSVWSGWANIVCGAVGLCVTVGLEIPRHGRLETGGKNDRIIAELIAYNWPRTLSITVSAVLTLGMVVQAFGAA